MEDSSNPVETPAMEEDGDVSLVPALPDVPEETTTLMDIDVIPDDSSEVKADDVLMEESTDLVIEAENVNAYALYETDVPDILETETEVITIDTKEEGNGDNENGSLLGLIDADNDKENGETEPIVDEFVEDNDESFVEITRRRLSQERDGHCYCGKDRNLNIVELLCASCNRWYHESCIGYQLGKLVPFMTNYVFICKNCSPSGLELFKRNQAQFTQMCVTALANLIQASAKEGANKRLFSKDKEIIPFFDMHWDALTTTTRRVTQSWHSTVTRTLYKDVGAAFAIHEKPEEADSPYFGLSSGDLTMIRPNYEAMIKGGHLKVTELGVHQHTNTALRGRGGKRRTAGDSIGGGSQASLAKKTRGDSFLPKMVPGHGYPVDHPYNKDGYRYILAEPDSNAPFRQEFDESSDWAGKPIPGWLYRVLNPCNVLLALHDRAQQLRVSEDRLSVTGEKGYCMIRATHGVLRDSWYFEAKITELPEGGATRIGFSQHYGNLQGPLGFDRYGYSWRSRYGTAFTEAKGKSFAKGGYGLGDVVGFLIVLPENEPTSTSKIALVPSSFKDRPLVRFKSHLYYEEKDDVQEMESKKVRNESKIICFKNGVCQGVAFDNIYEGTYYPAISLYKGCTVNVNFGPDFWAPPPDYKFQGMCDRAEDAIIQQTVADLLFLTENDGKLRLDNAVPLSQ